ncbi:MAG: hypothetical protein WDN28_00575 [Chthoniobacter sp.]
MKLRFFASLLVVASTTFAADAPKLPDVPSAPIAKKKELLFSDDFERADLGKAWAIVVPTFSVENGTLKGTQMRFDAPEVPAVPAADGKPEVKAKPAVKGHQAVIGNDIPTKDSVIEFRFKLGGAQSVTAEYDDRKFNGSHYGHICMARIAADKITLSDQKGLAVARPEGATGEPPPHTGGKNASFPLTLDPRDLAHVPAGDGERHHAGLDRRQGRGLPAIPRHRPPDEIEGRVWLHGQGRLLRRSQGLECGAGEVGRPGPALSLIASHDLPSATFVSSW